MADCTDCGQPMLPPGETKRLNEYDHARGCPKAPACTCWSGYLDTPWMVPRKPDCPVHGTRTAHQVTEGGSTK